jgi:hypothetical protein
MPPQYDDEPQTIDTSFEFTPQDTERLVYDDQVTVTDLPTLDNDDPTTETVIGPLKRPPPPAFLRRRPTNY